MPDAEKSTLSTTGVRPADDVAVMLPEPKTVPEGGPDVKLSVCVPRVTANVCDALLENQFASPAWNAFKMHVPAATNVTVLKESVHTPVFPEEMDTNKPTFEDAATEYVLPTVVEPGNVVNDTVCEPFPTEKVCDADAGSQLASPSLLIQMVQLPAAAKLTAFPDTVQTPGVPVLQ